MKRLNYEYGHTNDIMNKVPETLEWLSNKEINVKASRYSRYVDYINKFYKEIPSLKVGDINFQELNFAFQELFEIVQVYNAFKDEKSLDFNSRIKYVENVDKLKGLF
ncbi:hypothetical protein [Clostridioides sp. ES-S-0048-02]|uniref:hypothetical protein n=1 Tax=Clostridioides sp. ES-S-0048-02 TaxID=2770777 RepID=UPI001D10E4D9|nr:hypothetical protein [Clostridioides sp. ES-S-0048-02]